MIGLGPCCGVLFRQIAGVSEQLDVRYSQQTYYRPNQSHYSNMICLLQYYLFSHPTEGRRLS